LGVELVVAFPVAASSEGAAPTSSLVVGAAMLKKWWIGRPVLWLRQLTKRFCGLDVVLHRLFKVLPEEKRSSISELPFFL